MRSKVFILAGSIVCLMTALGWPSDSRAQVPAEVTQMYKACTDSGGIAASNYNAWVNQNGCICPGSSVGSGQRTCSGGSGTSGAGSTIPGLTPQQQLGMQIGTLGANMIGEGLHQLLYGPPVDPVQKQLQAQAELLNNSGIYLLRQKNYTGAINEFQQALAKTPNDRNIINNLALAKQLLAQSRKNAGTALQTSGALGQLLGNTPAVGGNLAPDQGASSPNASALNLVNLDSDPNVVDLRGTTKTYVDPASLKNDPANASSQSTEKTLQELDNVLGGPSDQDIKKQLDDATRDYLPQHPDLNSAASGSDPQTAIQNQQTDVARTTKVTEQAPGQSQSADAQQTSAETGAENAPATRSANPATQQLNSNTLNGLETPDFDGRTTGNAPIGSAKPNSRTAAGDAVDLRGMGTGVVDPARVAGSATPVATTNPSNADKALMKYQWETSIDPRYKDDPEVQQRIRDLWTAARLHDAEANLKLEGILADQFKAAGQNPQQIANFFANFNAIATGDGPTPKEWSKASQLANDMDAAESPASRADVSAKYYSQLVKDIGPADTVKAQVSYMGSGPQTEDDCVLYAIANGAQVPEKQVKTEFTNIVHSLGMDPIAERANPEIVVRVPQQGGRGGLGPAEELLVADKFGKVIPVPDDSYARAIASTKQPVVATIQIEGGQHKVVVTGVSRTADGTIYYSVMDSNLGPEYKNSTAYVEKSKFEARLASGGFVVIPSTNN